MIHFYPYSILFSDTHILNISQLKCFGRWRFVKLFHPPLKYRIGLFYIFKSEYLYSLTMPRSFEKSKFYIPISNLGTKYILQSKKLAFLLRFAQLVEQETLFKISLYNCPRKWKQILGLEATAVTLKVLSSRNACSCTGEVFFTCRK